MTTYQLLNDVSLTHSDLLSERYGGQALLTQTTVDTDSHNVFAIDNKTVWTHLRLRIFPDGGVSRLSVWGYPSEMTT